KRVVGSREGIRLRCQKITNPATSHQRIPGRRATARLVARSDGAKSPLIRSGLSAGTTRSRMAGNSLGTGEPATCQTWASRCGRRILVNWRSIDMMDGGMHHGEPRWRRIDGDLVPLWDVRKADPGQ